MAAAVETVKLVLDLQGFQQIQGLGNKFKALENPVRTTAAGVKSITASIKELAAANRPTIAGLEAQRDALTRVIQTVEIGTKEFKELTNEILRVKGAIDKANASMTKSKFGGGGIKRGLGIGNELDNWVLYKRGSFNIIVGLDNVGKTNFMLWYF